MDILETELAETYIERAPVQDIECLLQSYRLDDAGNYPVFKQKVEHSRQCKVRIEHNFPRVRKVAL